MNSSAFSLAKPHEKEEGEVRFNFKRAGFLSLKPKKKPPPQQRMASTHSPKNHAHPKPSLPQGR